MVLAFGVPTPDLHPFRVGSANADKNAGKRRPDEALPEPPLSACHLASIGCRPHANPAKD
jgi:hypothetical protein